MSKGRVVQVIGPVVDAEFPKGELPKIYNALKIDGANNGTTIRLTGEVQQHLGGSRIRAVALGSTDGVDPALRNLVPELDVSPLFGL